MSGHGPLMVCHPDSDVLLRVINVVWACDRDVPRGKAYSRRPIDRLDLLEINQRIARMLHQACTHKRVKSSFGESWCRDCGADT